MSEFMRVALAIVGLIALLSVFALLSILSHLLPDWVLLIATGASLVGIFVQIYKALGD